MRMQNLNGCLRMIIFAAAVLVLPMAVSVPLLHAAKKENTPPVYAGYILKDLYPDLAEDLKLPREQKGLLITGIYQGSAAEKAGLREGDVIVKMLDAKGKSVAIPDFTAYSKTADAVKPDRPVTLTFLRDGEEITASLTRLPGPLGKPIQPAAGEQPRAIKATQDGSGDCKTLDKAMLLARPGDTILIKKAAVNNTDIIYEGVSITRDNLTVASLEPQAPAMVGALAATGLTGIKIRNLIVQAAPKANITWPGVSFSDLKNSVIENCRIQGFARGIYIVQSAAITADGNIITGNNLGISVGAGSSVKITRNFIAKNSDGIAVYGSKAEINGNTIIENSVSAEVFADGAFLCGGTSEFSGSLCGVGVMAGGDSAANIYNNIIAYNNIGCMVWPGAQAIIEYNDVFQNLVAPVTTQEKSFSGTVLVQVKAANANFLNGIEQAIMPGETKTYIFTPVLQFQPSATNLSVDPLFADRMNNDYRPAADSPLAGKGRGGSHIGAFPPVSGKSGPAVSVQAPPKFGITARPVNDSDRKNLGFSGREGILVTEVKKDSPAERLALLVNDVILAVNGVAVQNSDDLKEILASGEVKSVKVFRGGAEILLEMAESF